MCAYMRLLSIPIPSYYSISSQIAETDGFYEFPKDFLVRDGDNVLTVVQVVYPLNRIDHY